MQSFLKSTITLLYSSLILGKNKKNNNLRILMYHSIRLGNSSKNMWSLDSNYFSEHLSYLHEKKDIHLYSCTDLVESIPENGIMITFDDGYRDNFEIAAPILFELKIPFSVFVVTDYIRNEKKGFMNPSMLRELSKNPLVTIGSHSKSHIPLTSCNQEELKIEISESKSYLEDLLGEEISMFSYPHGRFNSLVKDAVLKGGYKLAFTSHYDVNHLNQDKLALNRNEIWNTDNLQILKNKIAGDWDWLKYRSL